MTDQPEPEDGEDESVGMVWIRTLADLDGTYRVSLEINEDDSVFLDHDTAMLWAEYVHINAAIADYDSKVFRQLSAGAPRDYAIQILQDMRKDRVVPLSPTALSFHPGVNIQGQPFLHILYKDKPIGQWELADARSHAGHIIESIYIADLDGAYRRTLVSEIGLDDATARRAVDGLSTYGD